MSIRRDALANYLGSGVQVLAPLLALPWYLQALGPKAYGLLSFVVTLQAVLALVDAGVAQALVREFTIREAERAAGRARVASLLTGLQWMYAGGGLVLGGATLLMAPWIAARWIHLDGLPLSMGIQAVAGAAAIFATQFPGSLYRSVLLSLHRQSVFQCALVAWTLTRHAGGVLLLMHWPDLWVYLVWHALAGLGETATRAWLAWRSVGWGLGRWQDVVGELHSVWRPVVAMGGAIFVGALCVQIDRVLLSRMVGVEQFGAYAIAATLAVGVLQAINPLMVAALPRLVVVRMDPEALRRLSLRLFAANLGVVLAGAVVFGLWGEWLLTLWLRDPSVVSSVLPILSVALWGSALNALYGVGYVNWLAHGMSGRILLVNAASLGTALLTIPPLVGQWGVVGAAFGWVAMNAIGFLCSLGWLIDTRRPRLRLH